MSTVSTFGGLALSGITRQRISEWVGGMVAAGKSPSSIRHPYSIRRMILAQAVVDGLLRDNPADYVKLPSERNADSGTPGVVDDADMFLSATQVSALVAATPWPFNVYVHLAAWSGLRAAELAGLQVGDVDLPARAINPCARPKPGMMRVERTVMADGGGGLVYDSPKTRGSRRRVPLPPATVELLRDYMAVHPRADQATAPLFPAVRLTAHRPTGMKAAERGPRKAVAQRQADALAAQTVQEAELRLELDWNSMLRHQTFFKAVYRPPVLRASSVAGSGVTLPPGLKFHALRHT